MLNIPAGNYCRICQTLFCCEKCRLKHENLKHPAEIEVLLKEELMRSKCFICNGLPLPLNTKELMEKDMLQHIVNFHLPLQCDKCLMRFDTAEDFQQVGKCCNTKTNEPNCKENMGEEIIPKIKIEEVPYSNANSSDQENEAEQLTPLTKLNLRWRRKSREFGKPVNTKIGQAVTRTHSTPLQESFDSPPLQMSSIKYTSTSSEASPPINDSVVQKPQPTPISPKNKKNSINRQKPPPHNTPLRQVMTKSIQRAFAAHGHYKNMNIKQRRMTYESTSSSYELTVSLMKVDVEVVDEIETPKNKDESSCKPLDLRLSPALRRDFAVVPKGLEIRRTQSDTSIITNYVSCTEETIEKIETPKAIFKDESDSSGDDDDIFYTPRGWKHGDSDMQSMTSKSFVDSAGGPSNVADVVIKNNDEVKGLNFPKIAMAFRRAADYLAFLPSKLASGVNSIEENVLKRRRVSSETLVEPNDVITSPTPPLIKKRRIQGRRPIKRMQNLSYD